MAAAADRHGAWRPAPRSARLAGATLAAALLLGPAGPAAARTIALLVAVGRYEGKVKPLAGPANDLPAMQALLTSRMGAAPADIVVLLDGAATAAAIRRELRALPGRSRPGDRVIIYFSGHGTSARDPNARSYDLPDGTGAFVPIDVTVEDGRSIRDRLIVGRFDLRPLALEPLDRGGRDVLLLMDTCYSGNAVRGSTAGLAMRYTPLGLGSDPLLAAAPAMPAALAPAAYPYARVTMLAAAAETETAADLPASMTSTGRPQGALTDALLRLYGGREPADYDRDGSVTLVEMARGITRIMARAGLRQTPQLLPAVDALAVPALATPLPGMPALAVAARPLVVAVAASAAGLARQLAAAGVMARAGDAGDLLVRAGASGFDLFSSAGDLVLAGATPAQIVARARAEQWLAGVIADARLPLRADVLPAPAGGSFVIGAGDAIRIGLSAQRPIQPLVIDISPDGHLRTLYPTAAREVRTIPAGARTTLPDRDPIVAVPPPGSDQLLVIGLDGAATGLSRWFDLDASFETAQAQALVQWLAARPGRFGAAATAMRILPPR